MGANHCQCLRRLRNRSVLYSSGVPYASGNSVADGKFLTGWGISKIIVLLAARRHLMQGLDLSSMDGGAPRLSAIEFMVSLRASLPHLQPWYLINAPVQSVECSRGSTLAKLPAQSGPNENSHWRATSHSP